MTAPDEEGGALEAANGTVAVVPRPAPPVDGLAVNGVNGAAGVAVNGSGVAEPNGSGVAVNGSGVAEPNGSGVAVNGSGVAEANGAAVTLLNGAVAGHAKIEAPSADGPADAPPGAETTTAEQDLETDSRSALSRFSWRVSRFVTLYSIGMGLQLLFGVAATVLIVQALPPSAYGELGLYLLVPSTLLVIANLGLLQGTNHAIFVHAGESGVGSSGDAVRRVLCTGLVISLASGAVLTAFVFIFASQLSSALGHAPHGERLVEIGAVSGALAGGWRLASNQLRYARRPVAWAIAHTSRALFSLIALVILLAGGHSIERVILGFAIGTLAGFLFSLWFSRRNIKPGFDRQFAREILAGARGWVVIVIAYQVILGTGIYFVSLNASKTQVGLYSLAASLAVAAHYAVSSFIYSSGPLRRSALRIAVVREAGEARANAALFEAFTAIACAVILFLGLFGDLLVKIAPHSYAGAAALVPVLAIPALGRGFFTFSYSLSPTHNKSLFQWLAAVSLVSFIGLALLLGPAFHAYGIAAAGMIAFGVSTAVQLILTQRSQTPLRLRPRHMLVPALLTAVFVPLEISLHLGLTPTAILVKLGFLATFVAILCLCGVLSPERLGRQIKLLRADPLPGRRRLGREVRHLAPSDVALLRALLRERRDFPSVATERGEGELEVRGRFVTLIRLLSHIDREVALDWTASGYLTYVGPYGERDHLGKRLVQHGADPVALDRVELLVERLRRLSPWAWTGEGVAVVPVDPAVMESAVPLAPGEDPLSSIDFEAYDDDGGGDDDGH